MITLIMTLAAAASAAVAQPQLQPWSYLVGHCWAGEAPQNAGRDRHCFESVYGGQHIRDRHSVIHQGHEVYAGESLYSVRGPEVIFTYWNSLGGLGTGTAAFDGQVWRFSGTIHATASSRKQSFRATWRMVQGGYEVVEGNGSKPRLFKQAD